MKVGVFFLGLVVSVPSTCNIPYCYSIVHPLSFYCIVYKYSVCVCVYTCTYMYTLYVLSLSLQFHLFELVQWLTSLFPSISRPVMDFIYSNHLLFYPYDRVDTSVGVFRPPFYLYPVRNAEIAVADSDCASAIHLLHTFAQEHQIAVNFFLEVSYRRFLIACQFVHGYYYVCAI